MVEAPGHAGREEEKGGALLLGASLRERRQDRFLSALPLDAFMEQLFVRAVDTCKDDAERNTFLDDSSA